VFKVDDPAEAIYITLKGKMNVYKANTNSPLELSGANS
jgi:hypothetical protein